jgi:hypothetical protein
MPRPGVKPLRFLHWDHVPTLSDGRLLMPRITSRVHPQTASSVLRLVADWTAGSWNSGSLAFAIPPGLAERRATTLSLFSAFVTCYCSRCLSARGEFHDLQHVSPMLTHNGNIVCRDMAHMGIRPINACIPHVVLLSRRKPFLDQRVLLLRCSFKARSSHGRSGQEPRKAKCDLA